jgi:hypothetical protein
MLQLGHSSKGIVIKKICSRCRTVVHGKAVAVPRNLQYDDVDSTNIEHCSQVSLGHYHPTPWSIRR